MSDTKDHPMTAAWDQYKATDSYLNTKKRASFKEHTEGSLWASFSAGYDAALSRVAELEEELETWKSVFPDIAPENVLPSRSLLTQRVAELEKENARLIKVASVAGATIGAVYEWLKRVEEAGGTTNLEGIAVCHSMLKSLRKNAGRTEKLVMEPLRDALAKEPEE